jgi:hypothetical protein
MNNQILITLKEKLNTLTAGTGLDVETQRNVLKEELQFYVLNFIYHHPEYSDWIMYGGSALRICHDLDRMSVDLDFEVTHPITETFLNEFKNEIETHFKNTYGTETELLTIKITTNRGLRLCFHIGDEMGINHPSKQVIVKIDLNHFTAPKTVIERVPTNHSQLSFVIKTYNMSSLMASKIAAILLRGQRGGVGGVLYEEKGRDIYDLLWYMSKKAIPNLDYLIAKDIDIKDLRALFDKLTLQMNKVNDTNLKQDLSPLFVNQMYIENWLKNWRESYLHLIDDYEIRTVTALHKIIINEDYSTDNFTFTYLYNTKEGTTIHITYTLVYEWITYQKILGVIVNDDIIKMATFEPHEELNNQLKQVITLFYEKTEAYFKKTHHIMLGDTIRTKLIRTTADHLNQKEQIVLNTPTMLSCELEDLLK